MNQASSEKWALIDLSVGLRPGSFELVPVDIDYMDHAYGGRHLSRLAGVEQEELPEGLGWASEHVFANSHAGTHIDAPFHYAPQCGDRASRTVDELPLEWFWGPGVCIAVEGIPEEQAIKPTEIFAFEKQAGTRIGEGCIVLFRTGAARYYGSQEYSDHGRGVSPEAIHMLWKRGVRLFGTDAWSIDPPFRITRQRVAAEGPKAVWQAHYVGRRLEFCAIEKLCNLDRLPRFGFWVACFPIKIWRGSAAWTRAVALIECK